MSNYKEWSDRLLDELEQLHRDGEDRGKVVELAHRRGMPVDELDRLLARIDADGRTLDRLEPLKRPRPTPREVVDLALKHTAPNQSQGPG